MKTALLSVHWHVIFLAAGCFALWAFLIQKSGLKWPLAPAAFCFVQGLVALPFMIYYASQNHFWNEYLPSVRPLWAVLAALVGVVGLFLFTHEMRRLTELGDLGERIRGLTIASTVAIEVIIMIAYHYWDARHIERISSNQIIGVALICLGVLFIFKRKASQMITKPAVSVTMSHGVSEGELVSH